MSDMAPSKVKRPNEKVDISKDVKTTGEHRVGEGRGESDLLVVNSAVVRSDAIGCSIGAVEASMMPRGSSSLGAGVGNGISFRSPRVIGLVTASTFLLCFLLFGVINITAGTLITLASMRIDEEHSGTAMVTDPTPTAILLSDRPSPSNLSQAEATLSSIFGLPAGKQRGYQMKPQGHRGAIDARRLVGIVLLFAGTALICIVSLSTGQSQWKPGH
ncbi:uncharacterized protein LOC111254766 isoform X2 [Varroa destructor]|uniref:Transmembrane protein n=1 Tax=Varroa destructor TaxID=109461 RepID=A0A7M7KWM2_VARDE|nr:uncharacterized protein LOC111254766 isoform X2 [Varroa destructor]